jgi:Tfp pilus assembly protein PilO
MSTTAKTKLQKQISEIERAIVLPQIENQLPSGVEVKPEGEGLSLYEEIKLKLANEDTASEARRVQSELAGRLTELKQQLQRIEDADRHAALSAELEESRAELDRILAEVEPIADQLGAIFERAIEVDRRCSELFSLVYRGQSWQRWSGALANYNRYLPKLIQQDNGWVVVNRLM